MMNDPNGDRVNEEEEQVVNINNTLRLQYDQTTEYFNLFGDAAYFVVNGRLPSTGGGSLAHYVTYIYHRGDGASALSNAIEAVNNASGERVGSAGAHAASGALPDNLIKKTLLNEVTIGNFYNNTLPWWWGQGQDFSDANQGGFPVGFKMYVNLIMSEASTQKDAAGVGSVLINRMIAVGTDLNNPNWINKIGTKSQYRGFTNGQYPKADKMTLLEIQNDPDFKYMYQGALKAFKNWGTDYTGMPDGHPSYYWNTAGFDGGGPALDLFRRGKAILNTIDGIDFYSFKNPKGRWAPN